MSSKLSYMYKVNTGTINNSQSALLENKAYVAIVQCKCILLAMPYDQVILYTNDRDTMYMYRYMIISIVHVHALHWSGNETWQVCSTMYVHWSGNGTRQVYSTLVWEWDTAGLQYSVQGVHVHVLQCWRHTVSVLKITRISSLSSLACSTMFATLGTSRCLTAEKASLQRRGERGT